MTRPVPYETIPNGWYVAALSDELPRGRVLERRLFGREWVVWRAGDGAPAVQEAYCPHLGAHLGSATVEGDSLRCPFHGFEFGTHGACTRIPSGGKPPSRAKLETLPVIEHDGVVFAYFDAEGASPTWQPPKLAASGFTGFRFTTREFRGHPQEISENSSDLGHFAPVHAYAKAELVGESHVEGHLLKAKYRVARSLDFVGMPSKSAELEFAAEVHGLGYSTVHAKVDAVGIDVRLLVMPTPIDAENVRLYLGLRMKQLPVPGVTPLVHRFLLHAFLGDLEQDIPIWRRKRYVERPALAEGDEAIAAYRRYVRQFYPAPRVSLPVMSDHDSEAAE